MMTNNSYINYKHTFYQIKQRLHTKQMPKLIVFFGDNDALVSNGIKKTKHVWKQQEKNFHIHHKSSYNYDDLIQIWEHTSLFEKASMHCLYNIEKQKNFHQLLSKIPSPKNIQNPTILIIKTSTKLNNLMKKTLVRLEAFFIPCFYLKKN